MLFKSKQEKKVDKKIKKTNKIERIKAITDATYVIENGAKQDECIWHSPKVSFTANTRLIVKAGAEAIMLKSGALVNVYKSGEYEIGDDLKKKDCFDCDIYFVNKDARIRTQWGTPSKLDFQDASTGIFVSLGASGTCVFSIDHPLKAFERLLGTASCVTATGISEFFRSKIALFAKDALAKRLVTDKVGFYDLSVDVRGLSERIKEEVTEATQEYGITLNDFTIDNLVYPEDVKETMRELAVKKYILKEQDTSYKELHEEAKDSKNKDYDLAKEVIKAPIRNDSVAATTATENTFCGKCGAKL